MNTDLNLSHQSISSRTVWVANEMLKITDDYMKGFDRNDIFSFSTKNGTKKENEKQIERYAMLWVSLSPLLSELNSLNARLSSLLIKADQAMNVEVIVLCEKKFNAFEAFEKSTYEFTTSMESLLEAPAPSVSAILKSAQIFKNALNALIEVNA